MKLYLCQATATDYEPSGNVVASSKEEAEKKFAKQLDDEGIWYAGVIYAQEIDELDGYEIIVRPKRYYAKGSNYFN